MLSRADPENKTWRYWSCSSALLCRYCFGKYSIELEQAYTIINVEQTIVYCIVLAWYEYQWLSESNRTASRVSKTQNACKNTEDPSFTDLRPGFPDDDSAILRLRTIIMSHIVALRANTDATLLIGMALSFQKFQQPKSLQWWDVCKLWTNLIVLTRNLALLRYNKRSFTVVQASAKRNVVSFYLYERRVFCLRVVVVCLSASVKRIFSL